jgi:hypothetical protein
MESLNYVNALMLEVLRWNPVAPLGLCCDEMDIYDSKTLTVGGTGVAHASTHDDIYEGFFIPSGSVVIANIWRVI